MSIRRCKGERAPRSWAKILYELILLTIFGDIMFISKMIMEFLPNVHLLGMFTILLTVVFRSKALISIYTYVMLNGLIAGFAPWWWPYLYIWTLLWALAMLIPKKIPDRVAFFLYPLLCGFHGLIYGILYAPGQALMFGLSFEETLAWIAVGAPFDIIHAISNLCVGFLVLPLSKVLLKLKASSVVK